MGTVSFVIPCYNSENTIVAVVAEIQNTMISLQKYRYEVILVNDGSSDRTLDQIRLLCNNDKHFIGIDLAKNFGQHAALMAGFHQAKGDIIVCLDDDGQTPANEVGKLLEKIEQGYDVVYASYPEKQHNSFRNWGSKINSRMTEILLGKPKELSISSYFAAKRFIVDEMLRYEGSFPYIIGLVLRATKNICNVPVKHRKRENGYSGYTLNKLISLWTNGFTSFSVKPLRVATYFGCFSALLGFLYLLLIVVRRIVLNTAPQGWSSIAVLLLLIGGIILVVLGMIGEYIGRIYMCINASPQYVVREMIQHEEDI